MKGFSPGTNEVIIFSIQSDYILFFDSLKYLEKDVYTNAPTAHYYLQFNTSSRWWEMQLATVLVCKIKLIFLWKKDISSGCRREVPAWAWNVAWACLNVIMRSFAIWGGVLSRSDVLLYETLHKTCINIYHIQRIKMSNINCLMIL